MQEWKMLLVRIVPETWIIPPVVDESILAKWAELGWISKEDAEHLDRAFYRNKDGIAIITEHQLISCIHKAVEKLVDAEAGTDYYDQITGLQKQLLAEPNKEKRKEIESEIRKIVSERDSKFGALINQYKRNTKFRIVDFVRVGDKVYQVDKGYIEIFEPPAKTRLPVTMVDGGKSSEYLEILHSGHEMLFWVRVRNPVAFMRVLVFAGLSVGLGAKTARGYGRFFAESLSYDEFKPIKEIWEEVKAKEKGEEKKGRNKRK